MIYRDAIYGSRLRVQLTVAPKVPATAQAGDDILGASDIVITITNRGRSPVLVTSVGGIAKHRPGAKEGYVFNFDGLPVPKRFEPGDAERFVLPIPDNFKDVTTICVWDSLGEQHAVKRGSLTHLQRDIKVTLLSGGVVRVEELGFRRLFRWEDLPGVRRTIRSDRSKPNDS